MAEELEVRVVSIDDKVRCSASTEGNPEVIFDYVAPIGTGQGYTGLEGLLISLAACSGTTLVYLLRKMKREVRGFRVRAKGVRREEPPLSFRRISLEFEISSPDTDEASLKKALHMTESFCPVWDMIRNNVEIATASRIVSE